MGMNSLLTLSFLLGLTVDIFSDTLGVNSLACVLLAAIKRTVFFLYVPFDDKTKIEEPSMTTVGIANYCKFLLTMTGTYCFLDFGIEFFTFSEFKTIIIMTLASTVLSFPLLLGIDSLFYTRLSYKK